LDKNGEVDLAIKPLFRRYSFIAALKKIFRCGLVL
jgi:hypothetical protein